MSLTCSLQFIYNDFLLPIYLNCFANLHPHQVTLNSTASYPLYRKGLCALPDLLLQPYHTPTLTGDIWGPKQLHSKWGTKHYTARLAPTVPQDVLRTKEQSISCFPLASPQTNAELHPR